MENIYPDYLTKANRRYYKRNLQMSTGLKSFSDSELKDVFIKHDADGDKCLNKKELKKAFKELGTIFPEYRANQALNFADTNGDGVITDDEINLLVRYVRQVL